MTNGNFSRQEVENLVRKLDTSQLLPEERELLLAIFWAASSQVYPVMPQADSDPAKLQQQLIESFLPDTGKEFLIQSFWKHGPGGESTERPGKESPEPP